MCTMACQILLDFSPRRTLTLGDSYGPEAPLGRTQTGACDEDRPVCRRCISSRLTCRGYQVPSSSSSQSKSRRSAADSTGPRTLQTPPETPPNRSQNSASLQQPAGSVQRHNINIETEPPDWDFQQGIRYYFEIVVPGRSAEVRKGGHPHFHSSSFHHSRFVVQVIGDRISRASKARGALIQPGEEPAFQGLWSSYYRYLASSLTAVNRYLQDTQGDNSRHVFYGIDQLLVLDLYIERSRWHAHLKGLFAYIQHQGGIAAVLQQPEPPSYCLNHVLAIAINVNTTSPARQQIDGFDDFTDAQLVSILDAAYSTSMQCPTELYVNMVHISRLRAVLASKGNRPDETTVNQQVRRIFDSISHVDADEWAAKPMFKDKIDAVAAVGRIFAVAVRLYGILTLPQSATSRHMLMHTTSLCWPLIVGGVAVAGGAAEDQDFIEKSLLSIWALPNTSACLIMAIRKLRPFWASGKTGWEDCFDMPVACVV
ncbi:hypothetical protein LLEC1_03077 [Akanthomyces lecanii]|uniref:Zn(2)-C6 fungal-type domain-containing protein n=1 Tax=Cordyceps confragosa TaxID=2714763 RepID=A0A179I3S8_CORDF|nr:hypothetical protein LLEC1_03077 [Akanthomyces lecanii]